MSTSLFIFAAAVAAIRPAAAEPVATGQEIVVTGARAADAEQIEEVIGNISITREQQLARFHDEVCPIAIGVADEIAQGIRDRIMTVAKAAGARVSPDPRCEANLIVMFSGDGKALLSDIRDNRPRWVEGVPSAEMSRLAKEGGPVIAWSATSARNEDGQLSQGNSMRVMNVSFSQLQTKQHIDKSVILIGVDAAKGRTLTELADYAAMRGLSNTRPPNDTNAKTILNLFSPAASAPRELTGFDRAYLKALYNENGMARSEDQRSRMAKQMANRN